MSNQFDNLNFMERMVSIVKKYQQGEKDIKMNFEEVLEGIIQRIVLLLQQLEEVHVISLRPETGRSNANRWLSTWPSTWTTRRKITRLPLAAASSADVLIYHTHITHFY